MSVGKSRDGQAVAVPARLQRAAPAEEVDHRDVGQRHVGRRARRPARPCLRDRARRTPASSTSGRPTASMHTSAPLPSVSARTASTASSFDASTVCVAPKPCAHSSFRASRSTAMIVRAPTIARGGDRRVAHAAAPEHRDRVVARRRRPCTSRRRSRPSRRSRADPRRSRRRAGRPSWLVPRRPASSPRTRRCRARARAACRPRASSSAARCAW